MTRRIDLDSVRNHADTAATLTIVGGLTAAYAFHEPHSLVVPYVILVGGGLLLTQWCVGDRGRHDDAVGRLKDCGVLAGVVWWGWLAYGSIWEREHRLEGRGEHVASAAYAACGYWTVLRSTRGKPVYYAAVLTAYCALALIPLRSNVAQYMQAWDAALHVAAYVWTYFFTLYASVATGMEPRPARVVCASMWVLLVNRWWLAAAVPLWVLQLQGLANAYSRRPDAEALPSDRERRDGPRRVAAATTASTVGVRPVGARRYDGAGAAELFANAKHFRVVDLP